jgi:hypothetical protein
MTITGDYFFLGLLATGCFFTWYSGKRRLLLLAVVSFLIWFAMAMWLFFTSIPVLGITKDWQQLLMWVFIIMAFIPFLLQMDTEITHKVGDTQWKSYGDTPAGKVVTKADAYKTLFRSKYRRTK